MTCRTINQWIISSLLILLSDSLSLRIFADSSSSAGIESYARVSTNRGQPLAVIDGRNLTYRLPINQARSFQVNSRSPVYVPTGTSKLRNGEAIDHPSTNKYPILAPGAYAPQLDTRESMKHAQERFHPPASFEHTLAHSNAVKLKSESVGGQGSDSSEPKFPVPSYATLPKEVYSSSYDYQEGSEPSNEGLPTGGGNSYTSDSEDSFSKIPDSYGQPETYGSEESEEVPKFSGLTSSSSYQNKYPVKPADLPVHFERPSYSDASYHPIDDYNHDLIYDHPPDDHFHHHTMPPTTTTTTEEPEVNDQRLSKRPYSYYYIGKKLWYLPLYFSIYFIIYIAALVLKSITRHKINFPAHLAAAAANARNIHDPYEAPGWYDLTKRVLDGIDLYNSIGKPRDSS